MSFISKSPVKKLSSPPSTSDPFELIRTMNKVINDQKIQLQELSLAFDSLERQKQLIHSEKKKLQTMVYNLQITIKQLRQQRKAYQFCSQQLSSETKQKQLFMIKNITTTPTHRKADFSSNRNGNEIVKSFIFEARDTPVLIKKDDIQYCNSNSTQIQNEYIPQKVVLNSKKKIGFKDQANSLLMSLNGMSEHGGKKHEFGDNIIEDFVIVGPEINQFKNIRHSTKNTNELTIKSNWLFNINKFYKENKTQFLNQMALRAFPEGCRLKKQLVQNFEEVVQIISYKPTPRLSEDYFIFTLQKDESFKNGGTCAKNILTETNPNIFLYVVCLKVKDFIYVRDEKNYHRKESEIWVTQKIYSLFTYYPFFQIYINLLSKIHSILSEITIKKLFVENQNPFMWNLTKNVFDLEKNEEVRDILTYFSNKKPEYSQICFHSTYFGTIPDFSFKAHYSTALFASSIFFSQFAYEQFLLLLTAILCQKTIIFLSTSETISTLSALFLINLIRPFEFQYPLLLNCDSQKVKQMIFQFPFSLLCTIKKTSTNFEEIMYLFAQSNIMRTKQSDAQYIVVDIDSNTILYHNVLDELFNKCILPLDDQVRKLYFKINPCESKSFSLPKSLPKQNVVYSKHLSQVEKRLEEQKKCAKQYIDKINSNMTKSINFKPPTEDHEQLLKKLIEYMQTFTLGENSYEAITRIRQLKNKNGRNDIVREYLVEKNKNRNLINQFLNSQMYANYLDSILSDSKI